MYKVYGDYKSGNCYKVKLILNLLGQPYQWIPVDILKGETQSAEFLEKNPNGKIPVLELEDGTTLWESNAILNFLAEGTDLLPTENIVERGRIVKDAYEVTTLRAAAARLSEVARGTRSRVEEGRVERDVAAAIDYEIKKAGFERPVIAAAVDRVPLFQHAAAGRIDQAELPAEFERRGQRDRQPRGYVLAAAEVLLRAGHAWDALDGLAVNFRAADDFQQR